MTTETHRRKTSAQTWVILESAWRPSASPKLPENLRGAPFAAKMAARLCKSPPGVSFGTETGTPFNMFAANLDSEAARNLKNSFQQNVAQRGQTSFEHLPSINRSRTVSSKRGPTTSTHFYTCNSGTLVNTAKKSLFSR